MNNTPTPRTDAESFLSRGMGIVPTLPKEVVPIAFSRTLERELTAVTEQLKAAQDGWHDEITKGLSELKRAESIYTKAQERAERAEEQRDEYKAALQSADNHNHEIATKLEIVTEQRDRLTEAIRKHKFCGVELYEALQSLNQPKP